MYYYYTVTFVDGTRISVKAESKDDARRRAEQLGEVKRVTPESKSIRYPSR